MKKDKKKWSGSHGAVTVFLVIVLIPCLLFTCLFGDLSRVQMSKMTAESAADLTLQALMAKYDPDLKEMYGIVASCQNVDKFYDEMKGYFTGMMKAEGLPEESSKLFTSYLEKLKNSGIKNSDFLQVGYTDQIEVGSVEKANLGENRAALQKSIVEFMKYRGPVEITKNVLAAWSERDESGKVKDDSIPGIAINKEVSDKKQEYAEAEGEMLNALLESYKAIKVFTDEQIQQPRCPDAYAYSDLQKAMQEIYTNLELATQLVTMYYFPDSDNLKNIPAPGYTSLPAALPIEQVGTKKEVGEGKDKKTIYCINTAKLTELISNIDTDTITGKIDTQNANWKTVESTYPPSSDRNRVIYALELSAASTEVSSIDVEMSKLLDRYAKLLGAQNCEKDPDDTTLPEDWKTQLTNAAESIKTVFDNNYTPYRGTGNNYSIAIASIKKQVTDRSFTIKKGNNAGEMSLSNLVKDINSKINKVYKKLTEQEKNLTIAIEGDGKTGKDHKIPALDELKDSVNKFIVKKDVWGNSAKPQQTDFQKDEWKEFEKGTKQETDNGSEVSKTDMSNDAVKEIDAQSVAELKTRLTNIRTDMQECRKKIEEFCYGSKKVIELTDAEIIISEARTKMPPRSNQSVAQNKVDGSLYFSQLIQPGEANAVYRNPTIITGKDGNNPDLRTDPPSLYMFMHKRLDYQIADIEKAKENENKYKEESKRQTDEAKAGAIGVDDDYPNMGKVPAPGSGGQEMSVLTTVPALIGVIGNLAKGEKGLANMRDDLYVSEYIMDMCSYFTIDAEGMERYKYTKEAWEKEDATEIMENQSLTNTPFNKAHNHANLGEVEYILYGGADKKLNECVSTALANIYAVRMALDTTSGFCLYYKPSLDKDNFTATAINTAALMIAGASQGIIPPPVTKSILILALSAMEAASDVKELRAGRAIEFYKSSYKQWITGFNSGSVYPSFNIPGEEKLKERKVVNGKYYSDYLFTFLLLGMEDGAVHQAMINRLGDVIEANMKIKTNNVNYTLNNAHTHFVLEGELRVKPLFMTLPVVDNTPESGMKDFRETTDWCTYQLKTIRGYS